MEFFPSNSRSSMMLLAPYLVRAFLVTGEIPTFDAYVEFWKNIIEESISFFMKITAKLQEHMDGDASANTAIAVLAIMELKLTNMKNDIDALRDEVLDAEAFADRFLAP